MEKQLQGVYVFQICEGDAVAARTQDDARKFYKELTGFTDEELYNYEDVEMVSLEHKVQRGEGTEELITVREIIKEYWKGRPFIAFSEMQ